MNDLEETLRSTFSHAAGHAPRPPGALAELVETRYRRRGRRNQALLAAGAVVVIAGGATFALTGEDRTGPSPANPQATVSAEVTASAEVTPAEPATGEPEPIQAVRGTPEPIDKVWPQAVHRLPAKLATGGTFRPAAFIDDRTILVTTWASFEKTNVLYAYDLETREARKVADVQTPADTVLFASDFTIGDGRVAWWTATKKAVFLWSVPLSGASPRS